MLNYSSRSAFLLISLVACLGPAARFAEGQAVNGFPFIASNFQRSSQHGFGVWWQVAFTPAIRRSSQQDLIQRS